MNTTNANNTQVLCWNCEEVVHRYAAECPYCRKKLGQGGDKEIIQKPQGALDSLSSYSDTTFQKIQPLQFQEENYTSAESMPMGGIELNEASAEVSHEVIMASSSLLAIFTYQVLPVIFLIAGSFFFLFGVLIRLFSINGSFTLSWNQGAWPYFVFPAAIISIAGFLLFPRLDAE